MKKLDGKKLTIYLIINIVYILVGSILVTTNIIDKYMYQSVLTTILLFLNIIIIIWLIKNKNVKHKIDILILIILMLSLISSIFAYNVIDALVGAENRYEGLYMIMYYFSLFYISSYVDSKYKKLVIINGFYPFWGPFDVAESMLKRFIEKVANANKLDFLSIPCEQIEDIVSKEIHIIITYILI